jgi:hypothetical protein
MPAMDEFSAGVQGQALSSAQQMQPEVPFAFKALESMPGISQMVALNARKYSNTMFRGGYLDTAQGSTGIRNTVRRTIGKRTGAFIGGTMGNADDYAFGKGFAGKSISTRLKPATMANINPLRFDSVARLTGMAGKPNPYTPFQGVSTMVNYALKLDAVNTRVAARYGSDVINNTEKNPAYTGGVFGRIQTADRALDYEKAVSKAADVRSSLAGDRGSFSQRRTMARGDKAALRLTKLDDSLVKLGKLTNADFAVKGATSYIGSATGIGTSNLAPGVLDTMVSSTLKTGAADAAIASNISNIGRVRAIYETIPGELSKSLFGHYNIMNNAKYAELADTAVGKRTLNSFGSAMEKYKMGAAGSVDDVGHVSRMFMSAHGGAGYLDDADQVLRGGVKQIRSTSADLAKTAFKAGDRATAARMGGQYLSTYGKVAGKAFNAAMYATLAYDAGKLVGNMAMAGVNFSKDAIKSMQGTINKPIFGAGFKDNEVAATSRARGVMAIQNSRLNARSMLGSEAGMMAARFG